MTTGENPMSKTKHTPEAKSLDPTPEALHREGFIGAFRNMLAFLEATPDVPVQRDGTVRVYLSLEGQSPESYAAAAAALGAEPVVAGGEAQAQRTFGDVRLVLCAPLEDVTVERPVVTPERVFADPPERIVKLAEATDNPEGFWLHGYYVVPRAPCGAVVWRGPSIVHRANSQTAAVAWVKGENTREDQGAAA